jgi:hypothetical protein
MVPKIYEDGIRAEEVKGYLKDWMLKKQFESLPGTTHILYGDIAYVFRETSDGAAVLLITAYPAPTKVSVTRLRDGVKSSDRQKLPIKYRRHTGCWRTA